MADRPKSKTDANSKSASDQRAKRVFRHKLVEQLIFEANERGRALPQYRRQLHGADRDALASDSGCCSLGLAASDRAGDADSTGAIPRRLASAQEIRQFPMS